MEPPGNPGRFNLLEQDYALAGELVGNQRHTGDVAARSS
jgi:hypothetical protein